MSRFDVILIVILLFAFALVGTDVWLMVAYGKELAQPVWTFAGTLTGGEIVAFSLYQIAKQVTGNKTAKQRALAAKHAYIAQLQEEEEQDGKTQE